MNTVQIGGIQKLTLLDFPGKTAATLFLPGCNMNCPFCHNSELIHGPQETEDYDAVMRFLEKRRRVLDGVVISGGEPSLQDIAPLLRDIRKLNYAIKIDTNGLRPDRVSEWIASGLVDYIAMDIKNAPGKYAATAGLPEQDDTILPRIRKSIRILMNSGIQYEFRTTVAVPLHEPKDFKAIRELISGAALYFIQPFVLRDTVPDQTLQEPSDTMLKEALSFVRPYVQHAEIRGRDITD